MHIFKGKGGFFVEKKFKRSKRILSLVVFAALLAGGGFMGIDKFTTESRSLRIAEEDRLVEAAAKPASDEDTDLKIDGKAAVLIDGMSGRVLFEQDAKKHLPPASVTKVMTLLLVAEAVDSGKIKLTDKVVISENASDMGGSQMYMEPGEKHTVEELLKGVIMASANDGAVALAEHTYGSVENFVEAMNKRAMDMGLKDSHFVNTNGLPVSDHYSCAYDIGMISMELMKHEFCSKWFTAWQEDIKVGLPGKEKKFTLTNTNKLVKDYNGAIGIKTGFTDDAGYCLSGAAQRDSMRLIAVVLGCETSKIRFGEVKKLLDYGFAGFEAVTLAKKGEKVEKIKVEKASETGFFAIADDDIGMTVKKGGKEKIKRQVTVDSEISLPVNKGQKVGCVSIYEDKRKISEHSLVADRNLEKAGFKTIYIRMMKKLV